MDAIAYPVGENLYLNITNRCSNQCPFCVRYKSRGFNQKYLLWLEQEPTVEELMAAIGEKPSKYKEIVFCGYGEPTIRLDVVKAIAAELKSKIQISKSKQCINIRIDTNGLANLFWGRNILPELKGLIDFVSVSLNAESSEVYDKICHSFYGQKAYPAVVEFIKEAKKYIPDVEASIVDMPTVDKEKCASIAADLGVKFRVRPYYEERYVR
ncbi:radical SAM protein [candidate division WOR-1 bacterium RIFCSPHIGHO2_01_FULL_53_15]|uniref:Radical SAM protein n=1 Tax=candidate division WOR-1 bacterium RIFCSPHIGHO2_01_FULL_53_15 TaxID=1802564 RepID=A0A1F4Q1F0_UNCSA|nr:MAG: radical SAM protein [candidate division WOR-1 bacterium RIFCSPHIGHO2_01_FULL_53_15]OGC13821.1 MAG: radical SAM protein [candidate division WOR-1 bacterium RIFCSPHIGHO2_02_FULL_53_26]